MVAKNKVEDVIGPLIRALDRRVVNTKVTGVYSSLEIEKHADVTNNAMSNDILVLNHNKSNVIPDIDGDEAEAVLKAKFTWQERLLRTLESLHAIVMVVLLVAVAIAMTIAQTITGEDGVGFKAFDLAVMVVFALEIILRYYCFTHVHIGLTSFFKNYLNCVDVLVVLVDVALLAVPSSSASGAEYTKALRAIRLVRLVRIFRAARLVEKLAKTRSNKYTWKPPSRYAETSNSEMDTMVEAMNVLSSVHLIVEDRCVSQLLEGFQEWNGDPDKLDPVEIFENVMEQSKEVSLGKECFNDILLDNIMFENSALVQIALDLLMFHHTLRTSLLSNFMKVQLIASPKSILQYENVKSMLAEVERYIETNGTWGHLISDDDKVCDAETKSILRNLINLCKQRRHVLEFDQDYQPVSSVQDLLRNLGFRELSVKMRRLLTCGNYNTESVFMTNNVELFSICNELMYWFLYDNSVNQNLVFLDIQYYFDTLDNHVGSHLVIQALFSNNEELMRACPKKLIVEFTDKVCNSGQFPQYLTLHGAITNLRGKNIIENQYEIVKQLISPARVKQLVSFFCPIAHEDYKRKVLLMKPYLNKKQVTVEELPNELGYHLEFLRVLSVSAFVLT